MTETKNKKMAFVISAIIVVGVILLFIINHCVHEVAGETTNWEWLITENLQVLVVAAIIFVIPYEIIIYVIKQRNFVVTTGIIYGVFCIAAVFVNEFFSEYISINTLCQIGTLLVCFFIIYSYEIIKNTWLLVLVDNLLIAVNGFFIFYMHSLNYFMFVKRSHWIFAEAFIVSAGLAIAWIAGYFISNRKQKTVAVTGSIVFNIVALIIAIFITNMQDFILSWFGVVGHDELLNKAQSFGQKIDARDYLYVYRHPFSSMYIYSGIWVLILFILIFVGIGAAVIWSRKYLSKKRFSMMLMLYMGWSVLLIYTFLCDFGFVPALLVEIVDLRALLIMIAVMIRLFIKMPVPERIVKKYSAKNGEDGKSDTIYDLVADMAHYIEDMDQENDARFAEIERRLSEIEKRLSKDEEE